MIRCRGRNGWFNFSRFYAWLGHFESDGTAFLEIYSNSPHTRAAPVQFQGPPLEVVRLLRKIARELEADCREAKKERNGK